MKQGKHVRSMFEAPTYRSELIDLRNYIGCLLRGKKGQVDINGRLVWVNDVGVAYLEGSCGTLRSCPIADLSNVTTHKKVGLMSLCELHLFMSEKYNLGKFESATPCGWLYMLGEGDTHIGISAEYIADVTGVFEGKKPWEKQ